MKKITPSQKKIIIIALIIIFSFLIFWLLIYSPSKESVARIKAELQMVEAQLQEIEVMTGESQSKYENIQSIMERYQELNDRFPEKEEESLRMLSQFARELNIELIAINPQPKVVFLDEKNKEMAVERKTWQRVFVSIQFSCFYQDLVKYIEVLQEDLPAFVTIERLNVNKGSAATPKLSVVLELNLYLLS